MASLQRQLITCVVLLIEIYHVIGQLVLMNSGVVVPIGRSVQLTELSLQFRPVGPEEECRVQVEVNEPYYMRVGTIQPQVFDCMHFVESKVYYHHSGNPLLDHDVVKFIAHKLNETHTVTEQFHFRVDITEEDYMIVFPMGELEVTEFFGESHEVDLRVIDFMYEPWFNVTCMVTINTLRDGYPKYGELIKGQGEEEQTVRALQVSCDEFMRTGIRYRHLSPPTPDKDFIVLTVEVNDPNIQEDPFIEKYFMPVELTACFPNQLPEAALMSTELLHVDQFILSTLTPEVLSGRDDESPNEEIIFHIVQPLGPGEGKIVHLDDHTKAVESFSQADLELLNIGYSPPTTSFTERQVFQMRVLVYDSFFEESSPVQVMFAVRPSYTNAPRVGVNTGLTLLEGQSRPIQNTNFRIVDSDSLFIVRAKIVGGMRHGHILVNNRRALMFSQADIDRGAVVYQHDDSDTLKDSLELRITDGRDSIRATIPINILPKDDTAPYLINNVELEVTEGETVRISRFSLLGTDKDSSDEYIIYRVVEPLLGGDILKKYSEESYGFPVIEFTQRDLLRGQIYYQHFGNEVFEDRINLILVDNNFPPNESPTQTFNIKILQVHDLPPQLCPDAKLSLTVRETEVSQITKRMLCFTDNESEDEDLLYTITTPPYFQETHTLTDAGRIFSSAGMPMLMKNAAIPSLRSFTQGDINERTIAFMPPFKEGGPLPRNVEFVFSVSDPFGNVVLGQIFEVTVLPVNNQEPMIYITDFVVQEGGSITFMPMTMTVTDMDTLSDHLMITLTSEPTNGMVQVADRNLTDGDTFMVQDIRAGIVRYVHGGSDSLQDEFTISATDGIFVVSQVVPISIMPLNDEIPTLKPGLKSRLTVFEGGEVSVGPDVLSATDPDTNDMVLQYIVVQHPLRGVILKGGLVVNKFTQKDVNDGLITYFHTAGEIGLTKVEDVVTFLVSDTSVPTDENLPSHQVTITIRPVDNQPPGIVFGNPFFVSEGHKNSFRTDVISALDRDSTNDQITFHIVQQPDWGYVENVRPDPGSEKSNAGTPITSFSFLDVQEGNIKYVQSSHLGVEPTSDNFILYVTDGVRASQNVTFLVTINPRNDEKPTMRVKNFTVYENSFYKIQSSLITVADLDIPMEMLMFSIMDAPRFGTLVDRSAPDPLPVYDFNLNELQNTMKLTYVHDGSESTSDSFDIRVSDGKHILRKTVYVTIIPVNDERPEIVKNAGLELSLHESRLISPVVLLTEDLDTSDENLVIVINVLPQRGALQRKVGENVWEDIDEVGLNFTQDDVNQNLIRYQHRGELGTKGIDRFRFTVTDGQYRTGKETFRIVVEGTKRQALDVWNEGLRVREASFKVLTPDHLSATDHSDQVDSITFNILIDPTEGQIEDVGKPGFPLTSFTQLDLIGQRIVYRHLRTDRVANDILTFSISNGYETRNDTFQITIIPVDNSLPGLVVIEPISVSQRGVEFITQSNLHTIDQDTIPSRISYIITQFPSFGRLLISGVPVTHSFSQYDVDNLEISYRHEIGSHERDEFYFLVTDGTNEGFTTDDGLRTQPMRFSIQVDLIDSSPPSVRRIEIPNKMERVHSNNGFILSNMVLFSEDECGSEGILYIITRDPQFGYFENTETRQRIQGQFTQEEVDQRLIMYVIREEAGVTSDSFIFDVYDCAGNAVLNKRFDLSWSLIQFPQHVLHICETLGVLPIHVIRTGNPFVSSFVSIDTVEMTATRGADFIEPRASQLQFDPFETSAVWNVQIVEDELEEIRERFRVRLQEPVNALLGEFPKLTVVIKNAVDGYCAGEKPQVEDGVCCEEPLGPPPGQHPPPGQPHSPIEEPVLPVQPPVNIEPPLDPSVGRGLNPEDSHGNPGGDPPLPPVGTDFGAPYIPHYDPVPGGGGFIADGQCCPPDPFYDGGDPPPEGTFNHQQADTPINQDLQDVLGHPGWIHSISGGEQPPSGNPDNPGVLYVPTLGGGGLSGENPSLSRVNLGRNSGGSDSSSSDGNADHIFAPSVVHGRQEQPSQGGGGTFSSSSDPEGVYPSPDRVPSSDEWFTVVVPCSAQNAGEVRHHQLSGNDYICDGVSWQRWTIVLPSEPEEPRCEEGWMYHQHRCYMMSNSARTWDRSQRRCKERYNGNLVSILSPDDQSFVRSIMGGLDVWIGLNDKRREGHWEWVSGDRISFTRWKPTSNSNRRRNEKNCVYMNSRFRWVADECNIDVRRFICMKPAQ